MAWSPISSVRDRPFLPVANGTHFNGNGGSTATGLIQTRCRQTRKLLRIIAGGATKLQVEWANIWTSNTPQSGNASCEIATPNAVTARMSVEYPAGNPRVISGSTAWSSATAYALLDQVTYGGSSWVCIQAGTNQTPATGSAYWRQSNRYVVNWSTQTDTSGTVVFAPGDYRASLPIVLSETVRAGDCIAILGAFDSGSSTNYLPYAGANGASNTVPFVDWVIDVAGGLPTVGNALPDLGVTNQTNGNSTTSNNTVASTWMKIPYATAICGDVPIKRCVALFGDSLIQGSGGDIRDGEPAGIFARSVDGVSWWRIAQGGNRAGCYVSGNAPWQMSCVRRCTAAVTNLAVNDISAGLTYAQTQAAMTQLWTVLSSQGIPVYAGYPSPISSSTDAWATTTNQGRYTASGTIATTQFPTDADYSSTVYGQIAVWLSQDGASMVAPDGATVRVGQANHPLDGLLDWRSMMTDPASSWKYAAGYSTDGAHPTAVAAAVQSAYLAPQMEPVRLGYQVMVPTQPGYSPHGGPPVQNYSRSLIRDVSTLISTGSIMAVLDVNPAGRSFYGFRLYAGTAAGARTYTILTGADPAKLKVLTSGSFTTTASTIQDTALAGAPIWIPGGQVIAVVVTAPATSSWGGVAANAAGIHRTGIGHLLAGTSADTIALTGTVSLYSGVKFTQNAFRLWAEAY